MNDLTLLLQDWLPLFVGIVVFFLLYSLWLFSSGQDLADQADERLQSFASADGSSQHRRRFFADVETAVGNSWLGKKIQELLDDADLSWSIFTFFLVLLSIFPILMAATAIIFQMTLQLNIILSTIGTISVIIYYLKGRRGARERALQAQVPEIALLLSNSLKAGMTLYQALHEIKSKLANPAGEEFRNLVHQIDLGQPQENTLQQFLERHPGEGMRVLIIALITQSKAGGDLVKTLSVISSAVLARQRVMEEVYAATTQVRYTSLAIIVMPLAILGLMNLMTDGIVSDFVNTPFGFAFFLFVYVVPQASAQILIRKVSKVRV